MDYKNISKFTTVHFVGIGGIGVSAIARMFLLEGKKVSGSDVAGSEVTEGLEKLGAQIFLNQRAENVPSDAELMVYSIAVPETNPERVEAKRRKIPEISYPELLGEISKEKFTIAVTGTHGKTTTTAMIAKILMDAGFDPTVVVGSFLLDGKGGRTNFVAGKSKYLVVEGCEYRRSFLNLHPNILVITNIDADHLDYYKDMADIQSAFSELVSKLPEDGFLLINSHAHNLEPIVRASQSKNADWSNFKVPVTLKMPGQHNILNAKASLAVAKVLGIDESKALKSLSEFSGTWRRFEHRGKTSAGALVYDDYGHHPVEISATLSGAREMFPKQKIVVVFQPHLYSRTKDHLQAFGKCFSQADEIILLPIYPAREKDPGDISSEMVVAEIEKNGQSAYCVKTFEEAKIKALSLAESGDVIITLGAGETNKVADLLIQ